MGVRRKAGNIKSKKHKRLDNPFFLREKKINSLMNKFKRNIYHSRTAQQYWAMNSLRNEVKRLLDIQSSELHKQNFRRRTIYYEQVEKWKIMYPRWKRHTYDQYLHLRLGVPLHLFTALQWFRRTRTVSIKNI